MERHFFLEEIEVALKESDPDKAPGPDGFNYKWLKRLRGTIKDQVSVFFSQFYEPSLILTGANSSFSVLIPKIQAPKGPSDYKPISLINSLFKLLLKVLVNRFKTVINKLILVDQFVFLKGRNIVEGILVVNEVIHSLASNHVDGIMLKIDFCKALT